MLSNKLKLDCEPTNGGHFDLNSPVGVECEEKLTSIIIIIKEKKKGIIAKNKLTSQPDSILYAPQILKRQRKSIIYRGYSPLTVRC